MSLYYNEIYMIENITNKEDSGYVRSVILERENNNYYILQDIYDDTTFYILKNRFEKDFKIIERQRLSYPITITNINFITNIA